MKMKKKGKVYPSPSLSSSSSSSSQNLNEEEDNSLSPSILNLLPATILVLVSILSAQDREVLAYLITRGGTTISVDSKKTKTKTTKKKNKSSKNHHHKPPVFDCECFDCYTSYWLRWDSSPNRELIHQIIEAFENHHLSNGGDNINSASKNKSRRGKKKEKHPLRLVNDDDKPIVAAESVSETQVSSDGSHVSSPGRLCEAEAVGVEMSNSPEAVAAVEEEEVDFPVVSAAAEHKGLARKVLPDVLGLFNSNFWRLWNPNA